MRNIDRIRQMSLEELAPLFIYSTKKHIEDYYWDGKMIPYYQTFWHSPSGNSFNDFYGKGYDESLQDCIKWLDSEFNKK